MRVAVTEGILKKGERSTIQYDVVLSARAEGGFWVNIEKLRFVEQGGRPIDRDDMPDALRLAESIAGAIPTLRLSSTGEVQDIEGFEQLEQAMLSSAAIPEADREKVRAIFAQPGMREGLRKKASEFWQAWVGAWIGVELAPGEVLQGTAPVPMPTGQVDAAVTVRHLGPDPKNPGAIRLRTDTVLDGDTFRRGMVAMMSQMMKVAAPERAAIDFDKALKAARRVTSVEVSTEPRTLRPFSATTTAVTTMLVESETREEREEHVYSFQWPQN